MSTRGKIVLALIALVVIALVAAVIVVPRLVDIDRYRPEVIARVEQATGKHAQIGRLSLTVIPAVSIRVDAFALENPAGFPEGHFLTARRIYAEVDPFALWRREIVIRSLVLEQPVFNLLTDPQGNRNFTSPRAQPAFRNALLQATPSWALEEISKVRIEDGHLTSALLLPSGQPGPTSIDVRGAAITLEQVDLSAFSGPKTAFPTLQERSGPHRFPGNSGVAFADPITPEAVTAGKGTFRAASSRFGPLQANDVKSRVHLGQKRLFFDDLGFEFYRGRGTGSLACDLSPPSSHYSIDVQLHEVDMARLLAEFPKVRGRMTGSMELSLKLVAEAVRSHDPLTGKQGTGRLTILKGRLPTVQIDRKLLELARLGGMGPASGDPTSFSSISADFDIARGRITSRTITIAGNGVDVVASGSLTLAGEGSVDYDGVARIKTEQTPLAGILAGLSGAKITEGKLVLRFNLVGTPENPRFVLKMGK